MGRKKKDQNPIWDRLQILEKTRRGTGWIYGEAKKKASKKKIPKLSEDSKYRLKLMHFQFHLYEVILAINNIDKSYYLLETKDRVDLVNDIDLDEVFMGLSELPWKTSSPIDGLGFRGKFVTSILFKVVRRTDNIITSLAKGSLGSEWRQSSKKKRYKEMNAFLEDWIGIVDRVVVGLLSSNIEYRAALIEMERMIVAADGTSPAIFDHLGETDALLSANDEDGLQANNITKMAFALATHSLNLKDCPEYDERLSYKDDKGSLTQVGTLGYAILKRRHKKKKLPLLYSAFQKADPEIRSRFYTINEDAPEITVGLKALTYSTLFYTEKAKKTVFQLM